MKEKVKKFFTSKKIATVAICTALLLIVADLFPFQERKVYTELIRLHILANSSSDEDIALKYEVRDAILKESESVFSIYANSEEAKANMEETGEKITAIANRVLGEKGKTYKAKAVWGRETYPEREYDGISLPAGEYYSLRILLGEAEGENWWCVLFPPLCLGASQAKQSLEDVGISENSCKTFTENTVKYKFKFKLLEWLFG